MGGIWQKCFWDLSTFTKRTKITEIFFQNVSVGKMTISALKKTSVILLESEKVSVITKAFLIPELDKILLLSSAL